MEMKKPGKREEAETSALFVNGEPDNMNIFAALAVEGINEVDINPTEKGGVIITNIRSREEVCKIKEAMNILETKTEIQAPKKFISRADSQVAIVIPKFLSFSIFFRERL